VLPSAKQRNAYVFIKAWNVTQT